MGSGGLLVRGLPPPRERVPTPDDAVCLRALGKTAPLPGQQMLSLRALGWQNVAAGEGGQKLPPLTPRENPLKHFGAEGSVADMHLRR